MTKGKVETVKVGSGLTAYEREPVLMDGPTRKQYLTGALVPAGVRATSGPVLQEVRRKAEDLSRYIYSQLNLPDPFLLIDINGRFRPMKWEEATAKGHDYLKGCIDSGFRQSAALNCPDEDHSGLWYASNLAIELARFDALILRLRKSNENAELEAHYAFNFGIRPGGLMVQFEAKFAHEKDALRGKSTQSAVSKAGREKAKKEFERLAEPLAELERRIAKGQRKTDAARHTVKALGLNMQPNSLLTTYRRRKRAEGRK